MLAFSGVAATAAQAVEAPSWAREGVKLAQGETHYITAKIYTTKEFSRFTLAAGAKKVSCLAARFEEGVLLGSSAGNAGKNNEVIEFFGNCTVEGNGSSCSVEEPIVTKPLKSELVLTEKAEPANKKGSLLVLFEPAAKGSLTTLKFKGTCTVTETAVTGKVAAQLLSDPGSGTLGTLVELGLTNEEAKSWLLNFPSKKIGRITRVVGGVASEENITLTAFAEEAVLTGTALMSLDNQHHEVEEANWGFNLLVPLFRITSNWNGVPLKTNGLVEFKIKNDSGVEETPAIILITYTPADWEIKDPNKCEIKKYKVNETCTLEMKYLNEAADELRVVVEDKNKGRSGVRVRGN
jgi:hypothetical protein